MYHDVVVGMLRLHPLGISEGTQALIWRTEVSNVSIRGLSVRVTKSSLDNLSKTAQTLNSASRRLNEAIEQLNTSLKKLNLGVNCLGPDLDQ